MSAGRIIAFIAAGILIFFGVLFVLAAFSPNPSGLQGQLGRLVTGLVLVAIGFGLIWLVYRRGKAAQAGENVTLKIDLPGNVSMDTLKCQSCGGVLKPENIKMVAGAPVVTCPYCNTTYQLTEEPKW